VRYGNPGEERGVFGANQRSENFALLLVADIGVELDDVLFSGDEDEEILELDALFIEDAMNFGNQVQSGIGSYAKKHVAALEIEETFDVDEAA
jgi:hypothetical protein